MGSAMSWLLGMGASVAALVVTAALKPGMPSLAYVHMAVASASAIAMILAARPQSREPAVGVADRAAAASLGLQHLGLVWTWAVLALLATYAFVLQWREWWHFVLAFALLAGACLWLAAALRKEARSGAGDDTLQKLARTVAVIHLGVGVITMLGLIIDGKMVRFLVARHQDWAAQNVFFFGGLAMAGIGWRALEGMRSGKS